MCLCNHGKFFTVFYAKANAQCKGMCYYYYYYYLFPAPFLAADLPPLLELGLLAPPPLLKD